MSRLRLFDLFYPAVATFADTTAGGSETFIAVGALSLDETAEISVHAGHAPNFLLFDEQGHLRRIIPNPYVNLHEDTAHKVADFLAEHNVRLMIAGDFGPHVAKALDDKGIRHVKDMGLANIAVRSLNPK